MVHFPLPFWLARVLKIFLWLNHLRFTINGPELKSRLLQRYAIHRRSISFRTWNSKPIKTRLVIILVGGFNHFPKVENKNLWNHHLGNMEVYFLICFWLIQSYGARHLFCSEIKKWLRQIVSKSGISVHLDVVLDCILIILKSPIW